CAFRRTLAGRPSPACFAATRCRSQALASSRAGRILRDPPQEDWSQVDELVAATAALAERLRHEPGLSRSACALFVKTSTNVSGIFFRSLIWPQARRLAGLPEHAKGGRPPGSRTRKKLTGRPIS